MKKIVLINPPSKNKTINRDMAGGLGFSAGKDVVLPPLDLLNMVTTLRKEYEVRFIDAISENIGTKQIILQLELFKPEVAIVNLALPTIEEDICFLKNLKKFKKLKLFVVTGINYTPILKKIIRDSGVDLIIYGESDLSIGSIIKGKCLYGTVEAVNNKIIIREKGPALENLDKLPIPSRDYSNIDRYRYPLLPGLMTTMQTSRGCPYPCSYYCPYPLVQGKKWRSMTWQRMIKEVKVIKKLGINNILFRDATFSLNKQRIIYFCNKIIKEKIIINWWCETRVNVVDEELLKIMKKAGCKGINLGIESLNKKVLETEGKPGVTLKDVIKIRKIAKKINLKLHFLMIIGLPGDDLNGIIKTFENLVKLKPESAGITSITPYPGTKLFEEAKQERLIRNYNWKKYNGSVSNMNTRTLSYGEIRILRYLLVITVYFINKSNFLSTIVVSIIRNTLRIWQKLKKN